MFLNIFLPQYILIFVWRFASNFCDTPSGILYEYNITLFILFTVCVYSQLPPEVQDICVLQQCYLLNNFKSLYSPSLAFQMFFEGVEAKVATGVKEEEIGYQLAYSKAELRKVIKEYPGKEVKKNLEHLYKKVEKQMCEEENLLQVHVCLFLCPTPLPHSHPKPNICVFPPVFCMKTNVCPLQHWPRHMVIHRICNKALEMCLSVGPIKKVLVNDFGLIVSLCHTPWGGRFVALPTVTMTNLHSKLQIYIVFYTGLGGLIALIRLITLIGLINR